MDRTKYLGKLLSLWNLFVHLFAEVLVRFENPTVRHNINYRIEEWCKAEQS